MVDRGEVAGRDEDESGTLGSVVDGLPIDLGRTGLSSLAFGAAVLGRGQSLVWFAEGERSPTGSLQPFKPGVGVLLSFYPVPVVPVFIRGTYEAIPRGRFLRRLENVTVAFGEPFDPRSFHETARPRERIVEAVRACGGAGRTLKRSGKAQAEPNFEGSDVQISPTGRRTVWPRGSSSRGSTSARK